MDHLMDVTLENVIDINEFNTIHNELAKLVDFSVVTVDIHGVPLGGLSNFTSFCELIRSSPKGYQGCIECDRKASIQSLKVGRPLLYTCHCGLKDCTAPIIVNGVHVGSVLGGQVLIKEEDRLKVNVAELSEKFQLSQQELSQTLLEVKVETEEYLHRCLQFYSFMANYFAETGIKKIIQEKLANETKERLHLQRIAKEQELQRMKAQMNPHFLFNALNSIARIAIQEEAARTEHLIYDLSKYLRYSIKHNDQNPKLCLELENLHHYLSIQKTRYGDRMDFLIDIEPDLLDWHIPSMTLQPIVENAIIHGIEDREKGGVVEIRGMKISDGQEMLLTVTDNGVGFPREILALFKEQGVMSSSRLGLGLMNTHDQIRRLYGNHYGLFIESEPNCYSCVSIKIPKQ
ncbi:MAG: PocR ligand-binding domain-containing protein [Sporomusaceae bacterium]|nr:PocR ligand-binding domain-containing protein [Sporomusaceae bacterium]